MVCQRTRYTLPHHRHGHCKQERYIDKLLQQHGMQNCNPVAVPFAAKCDDILAQLATPIENPDPKLVKEFQTLVPKRISQDSKDFLDI
jgi:hypothetical protein